MTSPPAAHRKKVSKRRAESGPQHPLPPSLPHRIIPLRQTQPGLKPKPARNFRKTGERTGRADPVWTGLSKASAARRNWADRRKASAARPGSFCAVRTASVISSGRRMPQPSGRLPGSSAGRPRSIRGGRNLSRGSSFRCGACSPGCPIAFSSVRRCRLHPLCRPGPGFWQGNL